MFAGRPAACAGRVVPPEAGERPLNPATGSVVGLLGRTGRLGLATERSAPGGCAEGGLPPRSGPPGPVEANPQAGGTVRPDASARLAGGGPPMAGHVCQSVGVGLSEKNQRTDRGVTP